MALQDVQQQYCLTALVGLSFATLQSLQCAVLLCDAYELRLCVRPDDEVDQGIDSTEKLSSTSSSSGWIKMAHCTAVPSQRMVQYTL